MIRAGYDRYDHYVDLMLQSSEKLHVVREQLANTENIPIDRLTILGIKYADGTNESEIDEDKSLSHYTTNRKIDTVFLKGTEDLLTGIYLI